MSQKMSLVFSVSTSSPSIKTTAVVNSSPVQLGTNFMGLNELSKARGCCACGKKW